jgi:hypothetical protein
MASKDIYGAFKTIDTALRLDPTNQKLNKMMDNVRKARTGRKSQGKQIKANKYLPA